MKNKFPKIWVLGASFETSNMGVNALSESSIKCIFNHWPNADVILRTGEHGAALKFTFNGKEFDVKKRNPWFSKNVFKPNNVYTLLMVALLLKIIPFSWLKKRLKARNSYLKDIMEADLVVDITAGDSFSDIYGMRVFRRHCLLKWLFILYNIPLILLPQTYGPFSSRISQWVARYILKRTTAIYSRDQSGVESIKKLLGKTADQSIIKFIPDVAFVLDPEKPNNRLVKQLETAKASGRIIVGLNISGLLYNGKYQTESSFGIKCDYQKLIHNLIISLMEHNDQIMVVLVPHVYANAGIRHFESDPDACHHAQKQLIVNYPDRIFVVEDTLDHKQIKYLIGQTDFFLGSRMHSCIAAISQFIPTIGIAYSKKFQGVFESVGIGDYVVDLRTEDEPHILAQVIDAFNKRQETAENLRVTVPKIQDKIFGLFDDIEGVLKQ
jgi:polysaccharide pyruvyl transferase WcaK-like protein